MLLPPPPAEAETTGSAGASSSNDAKSLNSLGSRPVSQDVSQDAETLQSVLVEIKGENSLLDRWGDLVQQETELNIQFTNLMNAQAEIVDQTAQEQTANYDSTTKHDDLDAEKLEVRLS